MSTLLIRHAECVASFDDARRELRGASVLVRDHLIEAIGPAAELQATARTRARKLVAEQGRTNVEVIQADARNTGLPPAAFDVAHARTVLVNVPDPEAVLAEMTRLVV